jgi:flagellar assembly factor FliW
MIAETMTLTTSRFGEITVEPDEVLEFPRGLLGFEACRQFVLVSAKEYEPFAHLQSLDDPSLLFVVVSPRLFVPHYRIEVDPREIAELGVTDVRQVAVWVIVTVPEDMSRMSINLQGPLLVNQDNNRGKQVVMVRSPYTTCHYIMDELQKLGARRPIAEAQAAPV